jgi:type I restriction enzyme S subunit
MDVRPGYKQTEVGVIPEDWEVVPLGDVGKFKNGINKGSEAFGHGSPFVNLMDVFGVSRIASSDSLGLVATNFVEQQTYDLRKGDVIFIRSSVKPSGVGLTAVVENNLLNTVYSGFLIRFRGDGNLSDSYKRHCFYEEGFRKRVIGASSVSANTNINQENLRQLPLILPATKAEQEVIADALSDADALIESLEQLLSKKRQLKQGAMQELLYPKLGWRTVRLGSLGVFFKGSGVRKDESLSGDLPCIRYGEIYTKHSDCIKAFYSWVSPEVAATARRLKQGDVLFAGSGETKEEIGKCVAFVGDAEAYAGGDIVILRPEKVDSMFLGYYLNTAVINCQKAARGQGDAVVHISAAALADIEVALPHVNEQSAIATILSDMDADIAALEAKLRKARAIKQGMMQQLLTGKIRLIEREPISTERGV